MKRVLLLLRVAVAFAFVYAAISGFLNPTAWVGYFPPFLQQLGPVHWVMASWGIMELLLAAAILFLRDVYYPALIAAALLIGVVVFNWGAMDIVFRDIPIALASVALALLSREHKRDADVVAII